MNGRTTPSGIQRYIKNRFLDLCIAIQYTAHAPISCSQFWRIFGELDWASWNAVNESFFGITIPILSKQADREYRNDCFSSQVRFILIFN